MSDWKNESNLRELLIEVVNDIKLQKGKPIPKYIIIVQLKLAIGFLYEIHKFIEIFKWSWNPNLLSENKYLEYRLNEIYINENDYLAKLEFEKNENDSNRLFELINENEFLKLEINEWAIVKWMLNFINLIKLNYFNDSIYEGIGDLEIRNLFVTELRKPKLLERFIFPFKGDEFEFKKLISNLDYRYWDDDKKLKNDLLSFNEIQVSNFLYLLDQATHLTSNKDDYLILYFGDNLNLFNHLSIHESLRFIHIPIFKKIDDKKINTNFKFKFNNVEPLKSDENNNLKKEDLINYFLNILGNKDLKL